jgi:hypothetical protein
MSLAVLCCSLLQPLLPDALALQPPAPASWPHLLAAVSGPTLLVYVWESEARSHFVRQLTGVGKDKDV